MHRSDIFFKHLSELNKVNKKLNKDFVLTPEMVYNELIYFQIEKIDIRHLFNRWIDRFSSRPGIKVLKNNNFCSFISGKIDLNTSFKLYIGLYKNIDENVMKIFEYLRSNNISHVSKVSSFTRNDCLTIRVNTIEDVKLIIDFLVSENIVNDINDVMPFVLENSKIGVVRDSLYAYNFEICKIISECFKKNIKLTSKVFSNYIDQKRIYSKDENLKLIYKVCFIALKSNCLEDLSDCVIDKKLCSKILNDCLKKTKDKYNIEHTKKALLMYLNDNNINGFTRGNSNFSYRQLLGNRMTKDNIIEIMVNEVGKCRNPEKLVDKYINLKFANEISHAKEKKIKKENVVFNCCAETYEKHGYNYALGALRAFKYGSLDLFDVNDKLMLEISTLITKEEIEKVLKDIIFESYPNMNDNELKVLEKQGLIETTIMNLVKGYVDIQ